MTQETRFDTVYSIARREAHVLADAEWLVEWLCELQEVLTAPEQIVACEMALEAANAIKRWHSKKNKRRAK